MISQGDFLVNRVINFSNELGKEDNDFWDTADTQRTLEEYLKK